MKKMSQISRHSRRWKTRKAMSLFCLLLMTVLFASAVLAHGGGERVFARAARRVRAVSAAI